MNTTEPSHSAQCSLATQIGNRVPVEVFYSILETAQRNIELCRKSIERDEDNECCFWQRNSVQKVHEFRRHSPQTNQSERELNRTHDYHQLVHKSRMVIRQFYTIKVGIRLTILSFRLLRDNQNWHHAPQM